MEVFQPLDGFRAHHLAIGQEFQILVVQMEVLERVEDATGAGDHAIPASCGKVPGKHLEHAFAIRRTILQAGVQHRVLIHVGHKGRRIIHHSSVPSRGD